MKHCLFLCLFPIFSFAQWELQTSNVDASFRAVTAVSNKVAWIGGSKGTVLKTNNGGKTWEKCPVLGAEKLDFRGIYAFDEKNVVIVSAGPAEEGQAKIFRSGDGGKTWQQTYESIQKGVFLDGVAFWDAQNGLVFGDPINGKWFLLRTSDGGKTWQSIDSTNFPPNLPNEAAFAASNSSLVVQGSKNAWIGTGGADRARVFYSNDRGTTWQVSETLMQASSTAGIFGLGFQDAQNGIAVGGDYKAEKQASENVLITKNGGQTWQNATATNPVGLKEGIIKLSNGMWLAVGPSGTCVSPNFGVAWQPLETTNMPFHAVACAQKTCWAVGGKGTIARLK